VAIKNFPNVGFLWGILGASLSIGNRAGVLECSGSLAYPQATPKTARHSVLAAKSACRYVVKADVCAPVQEISQPHFVTLAHA